MKTNKETENRIVRNIDANKWTDRGTDTHTNTKRETDTQTDKQIVRHTDTEIHTNMD